MPPTPPSHTAARHAVYWVPARNHPLWAAGCAWLGRDPERAGRGEAPPHACQPWRYGFHATLKAPMRLREGRTEQELCTALQTIASTSGGLQVPPLVVGWLAGFLALRPATAPHARHPLRLLADRCVGELDSFRAAPDAAERARRQVAVADDAQRAALAEWGYPHVFETWRFHLTLSDALPMPSEALADRARAHFAAALGTPAGAGELALFVEPAPGQPFRLARRFTLSR